jgi:hypothetical protein
VPERILAEFILFSPLLQLKHPCELHRHIPSKDALGRTAAYQGASFFLSRSNTRMAGSCEWIERAAMRELAMNFESFGRKRRYLLEAALAAARFHRSTSVCKFPYRILPAH